MEMGKIKIHRQLYTMNQYPVLNKRLDKEYFDYLQDKLEFKRFKTGEDKTLRDCEYHGKVTIKLLEIPRYWKNKLCDWKKDEPIFRKYFYPSTLARVRFFSHHFKIYLQEGGFDSRNIVKIKNTGRVTVITDKGCNHDSWNPHLPLCITDTHSLFLVDGEWIAVSNQLLGTSPESILTNEIITAQRVSSDEIMTLDEFKKYRKTDEYREERLQKRLEQETQELSLQGDSSTEDNKDDKVDSSEPSTKDKLLETLGNVLAIRTSEEETIKKLKDELTVKTSELETILKQMESIEQELQRKQEEPSKRIYIKDDQLFIQAGDHLEILPWYLENELLPVINLSSNSFDNVKVSGIDFTGTNANIDPQTVYNKDMSHGIYDGLNFTMKSFDGVNTDGASFEGCVMDFAKNAPQTRKKSDNSFQKKI